MKKKSRIFWSALHGPNFFLPFKLVRKHIEFNWSSFRTPKTFLKSYSEEIKSVLAFLTIIWKWRHLSKLSWHLQGNDETLGNYSDCFDRPCNLKMGLEMSSWQKTLDNISLHKGSFCLAIAIGVFLFSSNRDDRKKKKKEKKPTKQVLELVLHLISFGTPIFVHYSPFLLWPWEVHPDFFAKSFFK